MSESTYVVSQEHLDSLCAELRIVVEDASLAGNEAMKSWTNFGRVVMLRKPHPVLIGVAEEVKAKLAYEPINDHHYWLGEIHCRAHPGWCVALPWRGSATEMESCSASLEAVLPRRPDAS